MTTSLERVLAKTLHAVEQAAPPPPPDLAQSVRQGMRRRRRRHQVAAAAAVVAALVTTVVVVTAPTGPATAPATRPMTVVTGGCTVTALALPSTFPQQAVVLMPNDVDPTGRYVAGYVAGHTVSWAVLWVDGQPRILDKDAGSQAVAVNSAGEVVGGDGGDSWVYRDGHLSALPRLPGKLHTQPFAINSRGDIVGDSDGQPVIWPGDQPGHVRAIGAGTGTGTIYGLSDDGLIVGADRGEARLWNSDGTPHALPPGFAYRPEMVAGPWVLGVANEIGNDTGPVKMRYALWNVTTGVITPLATATTTAGFRASAIGESGALAGLLFGADHRGRPAVFRDGEVIVLPLPPGHFDYIEVTAVSGDGRTIVGTTRTQALLWHC